MKRYGDLTKEEQGKARMIALHDLLEDVCGGVIVFEAGEVQDKILGAIQRATADDTPWFTYEMVYEVAHKELDVLAAERAKEVYYLDPGERAVQLLDDSASVLEDAAEDPATAPN